MRKIYTLALILVFVSVAGCSKDILKSYDRRIVGSWVVSDIDHFGFSGGDNLPFKEGGIVTFDKDGTANYSYNGTTYTGSWDLRTETFGDETKRALQLTVVDYSSQQMKSDYFNQIQFVATNRFNGYIEYGSRTYVYRFKRI